MEELYQPQAIEKATQLYWQTKKSFQVSEDINKQKFYCLSMLPYPSGRLHMGHVRNYTIGDVIARYQKMLGKNVLQPMGWDSFGLPAENAAIKNNIPPAKWTRQNIEEMRNQMQLLGFAYDWSRELATCDPDYYHWEQWFFIQLYKKGLVYKKKAEVNWDPVDETILANEQVVDGRGWRSGALVERKEIAQWFLKITAYADELLRDIDKLEHWPEQVKTMQRNWIGKSTGIDIPFNVVDNDPIITYTTRPDTLYGVTFIALAPQHPLTKKIAEHRPEIKQFIEECRNIKTSEADIATLEKRGIPLNITAIHPLTKQPVPVWVANFVVMDYGTGAIMGVPANDERDFEFAKKYDLPVKEIDPVATPEETDPLGKHKVNFRLRDWSISRQRYWGTPVPIINCPQCGAVPVPESDLPVILPEDVKFEGIRSPLTTMPSFLNATCPTCQGPAERETDTFDTFIESSWYYARYTCKKQNKSMLDGRANYWLPVDQYVGGIEHAVMHLLYARFFHKLMRDEGLVNSDEPFTRLLTQGMVLNEGIKMSKSKGNVVDPQALIEKYGADTVRLFIMFAAPPEQSLEWSDSGVEGASRFLKRVWAYAYANKKIIHKQNRLPQTPAVNSSAWDNADQAQIDIFRQLYEILEQAKFDYDRLQFNTVVSSCMKIFNLLTKLTEPAEGTVDIRDTVIHRGFSILLRLLAPITPHITHQLWQDLDYEGIILEAEWPKSSNILFKVDAIELVIQVNGKLRSRIRVPQDATQQQIETAATNDPKVQTTIKDQTIKKIIIVPGKLVNIVAGA